MIYLASPYSHEDSNIMDTRYEIVAEFAAKLALAGFHVYSPIAAWHNIAKKYDIPRKFEFWKQFDHEMILKSDFMIVMKIWGVYQDSVGVQDEIAFAKENNIPVFFTEE